MNKLFLGLVCSTLLGLPVWAALKVADKAPDFSARASLAGKEFNFSLQDAIKKGPVVVYFYPSAYTKGCDLEAHTFAQEKDKFDAAGATIIGVSADSIERLDAFSADPDYCAGKFPVASDPDRKIANSNTLCLCCRYSFSYVLLCGGGTDCGSACERRGAAGGADGEGGAAEDN